MIGMQWVMTSLFEYLQRFVDTLNKIIQKSNRKIPDISETYPLGIRANLRVHQGDAYYLVISPDKTFFKRGTSAVDLNLEATESFWIGAFRGEHSIISGLPTGKLKVRGLRSSFVPLVILSSLVSLFDKLQ